MKKQVDIQAEAISKGILDAVGNIILWIFLGFLIGFIILIGFINLSTTAIIIIIIIIVVFYLIIKFNKISYFNRR